MKFFTAFYNSLFNVTWLKQERTRPRRAWGYFFVLSIVLAAFYTIPLLFVVPSSMRSLPEIVTKNVPDNFKAEIRNDELQISGITQPFIIRNAQDSGYVVVIDTISTSTVSLDTYLRQNDQGGLLITREKIELYNPPSHQVTYMKEIGDISFTKADILRVTNWFSGTGALVLLSIVIVITILIVLVVWKLWTILWAVILAYLVSRLFGRGWRFGELWVVGLYAVTLPSVILLILALLSVMVSWLHFVILLAFLLALVLTKSLMPTSMMPPSSEEKNPPPAISP